VVVFVYGSFFTVVGMVCVRAWDNRGEGEREGGGGSGGDGEGERKKINGAVIVSKMKRKSCLRSSLSISGNSTCS
jgi:hypothetical protein